MKQVMPRAETFEAHMADLVPLFKELLSAGKTVRFSPRGISMLPMLRQGIDTVTLSPISGGLNKYDLPLYQRDDGKYILHRIVKVGTTYTCIGDNQFVYEHGVRDDQMIAVVSSFTRGTKEIEVTRLRYRLYCRFWHYSRFIRHVFRALKRRIGRLFGV